LAGLQPDDRVRTSTSGWAPSCSWAKNTVVERLDNQELAVLKTALTKVIVDCTFG
jgi:hypothetical protein